jgi:coatomer subunit delta
LQQIKTNLEMESHEEKLHNMIKISKIESAKDQALVAARAIKDKQKEAMRLGAMGGGGGMSGMGGGGFESSSSGLGNGNASSSSLSSASSFADPISSGAAAVPSAGSSRASSNRQPVKGMSLGAGTKNKSAEDALMREDKLAPLISASKNAAAQDAPTTIASAVAQQPIMLSILEKVSATLSRDGNVESFDIKGSLTLTAADDEAALCSVQLKPSTSRDSIFSFNTHPKVNKPLYEKTGLLQLKETNKGFPSARPVGILKWTHTGGADESLVPLKINCWPEEESRGQMNVSMEYSMDVPGLELHDVRITIPLGTNAAPSIVSVDGAHKHNAAAGELVWQIDLIDASNSSGSLEFNVQQRNTDAFFPINVQFASQKLFCSIEVVGVNAGGENKMPMVYGLTKSMSSEEYIIN